MQLVYTIYISVDLVHYGIVRDKVNSDWCYESTDVRVGVKWLKCRKLDLR